MLTLAELLASLAARRPAATRRASAGDREADYRTTDVPDLWEGMPESDPAGGRRRRGVDGRGRDRHRRSARASSTGHRAAHPRPADDDPLEPGEILVCTTTDPSWASTMMLASALVIDIGGPISHGAIVARELGIPCVIGTRNGTAAIRSGDRVEVDGGAGEVVVVERA